MPEKLRQNPAQINKTEGLNPKVPFGVFPSAPGSPSCVPKWRHHAYQMTRLGNGEEQLGWKRRLNSFASSDHPQDVPSLLYFGELCWGVSELAGVGGIPLLENQNQIQIQMFEFV